MDNEKPLWAYSAIELHERYKSGQCDPVAVVTACFDRIETVNPLLNAVISLNRDDALAAARMSRDRFGRDSAISVLDGVPCTIKDNLFVKGLPATWGSELFKDHIAVQDDIAVSRLRDHGMVILGKTNTPELSLAGYTDNRLFGPTGNPWAPLLTSGGSSGGAASAVMSGMGVLALVTDAGGSCRRPASHVGCIGLKPGPGRIPRRFGFPPLAADLQSISLLARSAIDARTMFQAVGDPSSLTVERAQPLKIAAFAKIQGHPIEPEVLRLWREAVQGMIDIGHQIEIVEAPFNPVDMDRYLMKPAAAGVFRAIRKFKNWPDVVTENINKLAQTGAAMSAAEYLETLDEIREFRSSFQEFFGEFDLILTPTAPTFLWPKQEPYPKSVGGKEGAPRTDAIYTTFANVAGLAGISVPAGIGEKIHPVGIQFVGPEGCEEVLLDLAETWQAHRPWPELAPLRL